MPEDLNIRKLRVFVKEKPHVLADILNLLATERISVRSVNTRTRKKKVMLAFKVESEDMPKLQALGDNIKNMRDVLDVKIDEKA